MENLDDLLNHNVGIKVISEIANLANNDLEFAKKIFSYIFDNNILIAKNACWAFTHVDNNIEHFFKEIYNCCP